MHRCEQEAQRRGRQVHGRAWRLAVTLQLPDVELVYRDAVQMLRGFLPVLSCPLRGEGHHALLETCHDIVFGEMKKLSSTGFVADCADGVQRTVFPAHRGA